MEIAMSEKLVERSFLDNITNDDIA